MELDDALTQWHNELLTQIRAKGITCNDNDKYTTLINKLLTLSRVSIAPLDNTVALANAKNSDKSKELKDTIQIAKNTLKYNLTQLGVTLTGTENIMQLTQKISEIITEIDTKISITLSTYSITYNDNLTHNTVITTILQDEDNNFLTNQTVTLKNGTTTIATITTDNIGSNTYTFKGMNAGTYNITANFNGKDKYQASSKTANTLTVAKADGRANISLSSTNVGNGGGITVTATGIGTLLVGTSSGGKEKGSGTEPYSVNVNNGNCGGTVTYYVTSPGDINHNSKIVSSNCNYNYAGSALTGYSISPSTSVPVGTTITISATNATWRGVNIYGLDKTYTGSATVTKDSGTSLNVILFAFGDCQYYTDSVSISLEWYYLVPENPNG